MDVCTGAPNDEVTAQTRCYQKYKLREVSTSVLLVHLYIKRDEIDY